MVDQVKKDNFYEKYWEDYKYKEKYAFYVAFEDRVPAINKVWSNFKKPNKVLDFGCGNGVLTYLLKCSGFGKNIVGVDVSNTFLRVLNVVALFSASATGSPSPDASDGNASTSSQLI